MCLFCFLNDETIKTLLILKVLPREYGQQYTWNFIFQKDFWRKKIIVNNCSSSLKVKTAGKNSESAENLFGQDTFKPAIEAISLDMKQQELDGRYMIYNSSASTYYDMIQCLLYFLKLLGAFKSGICIKCMLLKKEIAALSTHYS